MTTWTQECHCMFILALLKCKQEGKVSDLGLKKEGWMLVLKDFNTASGLTVTKTQLQLQYQTLKNKYTAFELLKNNSGFGWNDDIGVPTAPDNVWEEVIAGNKLYAEFCTKPLFMYDELNSFFGG